MKFFIKVFKASSIKKFNFVNIKSVILDIYFIYSYGKSKDTFNVLTFVIICQCLLFNLLRFLYLKLINCLDF